MKYQVQARIVANASIPVAAQSESQAEDLACRDLARRLTSTNDATVEISIAEIEVTDCWENEEEMKSFLWTTSDVALIVKATDFGEAHTMVIAERMKNTTPGLTQEGSQEEAEGHFRKNDQLIEIDGEL